MTIKDLQAAFDAAVFDVEPQLGTEGQFQWRTRNGKDAAYYFDTEQDARDNAEEWLYTHNDMGSRQAEFLRVAQTALPDLLQALELLKVAAHALETPGDFSPEELKSNLREIGVFLAKIEGEADCDPTDDAGDAPAPP